MHHRGQLALIMGQPLDSSLVDLYDAWAKLGDKPVPPKYVDKASGPCRGKHLTGDDIDLSFRPNEYSLDGGRYIGTPLFHHQGPESGWVNWAPTGPNCWARTRWDPVHQNKHADIMLKKYQAWANRCRVASIIGCDPLFILGAARIRFCIGI
jgi:UbiD family decarboxylase